MRQKLLSLGSDYVIEDDQGRERFRVDGKAFSFGDKLSFQDMSGEERAFIREKHLSWGPTYVLILATTVVIDLCCHSSGSDSH
jgi:uncharacterized protein YxjI